MKTIIFRTTTPKGYGKGTAAYIYNFYAPFSESRNFAIEQFTDQQGHEVIMIWSAEEKTVDMITREFERGDAFASCRDLELATMEIK